jgi:hypothetical protein
MVSRRTEFVITIPGVGTWVNAQRLLGHAEIRSARIYLCAEAERQREAVEPAGLDEIIGDCAKICARVVPKESGRGGAAFATPGNHSFKESAPVAQLDRASDFESAGRVFESPRAHQSRSQGP